MENLTQFVWPRATGRGYIWQTLTARHNLTGRATPNARSLTYPSPDKPKVVEWIQPHLICTSLLWQLAATGIDEESITTFANAHGLLEGHWFGAHGGRGSVFEGDLFSRWREEILRAYKVITLWTALEKSDQTQLARMINVTKSGGYSFKWKDQGGSEQFRIAGPSYRPEIYALCQDESLELPARAALIHLVNEQLVELSSPQLLLNDGDASAGLYLRPKNLLGAMWVQFAQAIDQRKNIGKCTVCGTWFERSRSDKRYCSRTCNVRASRSRNGASK